MPSPADDYEAHRKIGRWVRLMIVHPATPAAADAGGEPGAETVVGPAAAARMLRLSLSSTWPYLKRSRAIRLRWTSDAPS